MNGSSLLRLAELAEAHGSHRIRTTPMQKLLVLDLDESQVASLLAGVEECGLSARRDAWRRSVMACTGIEFCKLAIVETKAQAARVVDELERRLGALDSPITRPHQRLPQLLRPDPGRRHRPQGPARGRAGRRPGRGLSRCTSAADSVWTPGFGRKLRGHKVTADELPDYVERLARDFVAERRDGERFAQWVARADEVVLS